MHPSVDFDLSISNEQLIAACSRGNESALRELYNRHQRSVYCLLLRMLSNADDAEEAVADVFVKVWKSAKSFRGSSKFTTWLFRIAANTAKDALRSRATRREVYLEDSCIGESLESNIPGPEQAAIRSSDTDAISKALLELTPEDRLIITLYHFNEMDYEEIGAITGIGNKNLKVKLFRARQKLKLICGTYDEEADSNEVRTNTTESVGLQQGTTECA